MFATLLGALPSPPTSGGASSEALLETVVRAQEAAGLDPLTDGGLLAGEDVVDAWRATAALTDRAVKAVLPGPFSGDRRDATADALNRVIRDLARAGCPLVEIHEPAATRIGTDADDRDRFRELQQRLLDGVTGTHLSLAITGGDAAAAGVETLLAAPYASLAVDLIAGPDNWNLVVRTPGDRGVVCGVLPAAAGDDGPELIVWAAGYAASTAGRGADRVGIATASSLAHLEWDIAVTKMERLGEALRIAMASPDERRAALDPRALDSRSAALGRHDAATSRPPRRGDDPT